MKRLPIRVYELEAFHRPDGIRVYVRWEVAGIPKSTHFDVSSPAEITGALEAERRRVYELMTGSPLEEGTG